MKNLKHLVALLSVALLVWGVSELNTGCSPEEKPEYPDGGGGNKEGEKCSSAAECDMNLVCAGSGTCQKGGGPGTHIKDEGCAFNTDCLYHLVCSSKFKCVLPGPNKEGDGCMGNEHCQKGLLCSYKRKCSKPGSDGTKGPNETCSGITECAWGLVCAAGTCKTMTYWAGASCAKDDGALTAYFEVPRTGKKVNEFYRLPFPNDIRLRNGKVDLTGHPAPTAPMYKEYGDVIGNFIKGIGSDVGGFGLNTAVFFRMSNSFTLNTIKIEFLNIDKNSPDYGKASGWSMGATAGDGSDSKYICRNHIVVRPAIGKPLLPLTTYAVFLKKGITDTSGKEAAQDEDFKKVMSPTAPADPDLKAAWTKYAPLRDYLTDKSINPALILNAAVFTTMNPRYRMSTFRDVITNQVTAPVATKLTLCDGKSKSPCDDGMEATHKCPGNLTPSIHELHGTYQTPVFQTGKLPYKLVTDGGTIAYDSQGKPIVQRSEKACFALTIPAGATMPLTGWPVVIYAHGTNGSFRSFVDSKVATNLSLVKDATGTVSQMAVISTDACMHGPRRGSTEKPEELFFNLRNPRASRDNVYQGAADKFQLLRLIKSINLDAAKSPTKEALKFDLNKIYYFGHSQGTVEGIPFLAFEPEVQGAVLSGAGGYLIGSLLNKTKPVNVAGIVKLALADPNLSASHPMLNLLQLFYEEVDSINYGQAMFNKPEGTLSAKHLLLSYGVADSYTPVSTTDALAWSMRLRQVQQKAERCGDSICGGTETCGTCGTDCGTCPASCGNAACEGKNGETCNTCPKDCKACPVLYAQDVPPVKENIYSSSKKYTVGLVKYAGDGTYDDHLVVFNVPAAKTQTTYFLGTGAKDGAPTIAYVP